ncbi:class I SAM-dependent DNA methyltransferase [Sanguibacter suaedae]|uniref:site-specific DNA-methyltransferase (adenine-specific) n=1 Tax=Sanguibacter suaedae TaxID=2795737 RepID=A0A934IBT8_9MICO|nr:class I SAM-dependent DNA methyltransferase [Sanguibacter suaedae]MBI9114981.1 class I SAM-dependent DNA methyltransferase [Sanguibacter suaedae]
MAASDALVIGEDWISEHYFTTDATKESFQAKVLERRKAWDATEHGVSARAVFTGARGEIETLLGGLLTPEGGVAVSVDAVHDVYARLLDVLGYTGPGRVIEEECGVRKVSTPGVGDGAPLIIVEARPVAAIEELLEKDALTLLEPFAVDDAPAITSASRLLSAFFVRDDGPDFALVLAGRWLLITDKERWPEGRYLAVDLQLVAERNDTRRGGELDRAIACVGVESLAPDADGVIWWTGVQEASVKHTVGVSKDLREGVRRSIEIIANEVLARRSAQGLGPLDASYGQVLATQSLRYLYRILFLLYAEASPELKVLPVGAGEYEQGYSIDRLRELTLVKLATPRAEVGTHLFDSLGVLFDLVDRGHGDQGADDAGVSEGTAGGSAVEGLEFNSLRADLFRPEAIALIDEVGLGNLALQQVLGKLLLSKESRGKDRGFISYAELGINQLGAVYEGLMSYTGFFATEDLFEVAKGGDAEKGSWVVPVACSAGISDKDFVMEKVEATGEERAVRHRAGTFVYRLAGRDRQQSASYYTPEVLTRFTVGQALEELVTDEHTAEDILSMTVCEPALGSGAFAIEAVRQLAEQYLTKRQRELGEKIDPDAYPIELQRTKAYIALHNVYGVDLNATAIELAEISLWLDTMVAGLQAPWFGLHLRRGNSLIGARRATYSLAQVVAKSWLKTAATEASVVSLAADAEKGTVGPEVSGRIHHFLLPAAGWGSATEAKEAKDLAPDARAALNMWRKSVLTKPTKKQLDALVILGYRVEELWQLALRRRQIAEDAIRRSIDVWGRDTTGAGSDSGPVVSREEIEEALADRDGSYQRLRRVMDAWCALWFWPLTEDARRVTTDGGELLVAPPTVDQWIAGLQELLGSHSESALAKPRQSSTFGSSLSWDELGEAEELERRFVGARDVEGVLTRHPWLQVTERIAAQQGFFHWELDFATVFARGGFDLQVGNPPWVRPRSDVDALLAEGDPWWQLELKPSERVRAIKRVETLTVPGIKDLVLDETSEVTATAAFVGSELEYPHLAGLQPDLYRCFMEKVWRHGAPTGVQVLIHLESHFTDEKAGLLRSAVYRRTRRHWQFINELSLFEIQHQKTYGVNVYGPERESVSFLHAVSLYHPDMVGRSLSHNGDGVEPGIKDDEGKWDQRPHVGRVITVDEAVLKTWHAVLESTDVPVMRTRMLYTVNRSVSDVLGKLSKAPRIGTLDLKFSSGWHEKNDRTKGYFESRWGAPGSWDDVILQGPHLYVATPLYKNPNSTLLHHLDWSATDFETLAPDAIPVTSYKRAGDDYEYDVAYTDWGTEEEPNPARDHYRVAWRCMAANTGERTLIPSMIPPGAAHVDGIYSAGLPGGTGAALAGIAGFMSSLLSDFAIRVAPKSTIRIGSASRLPYVGDHVFGANLRLRSLRLNCVSEAYADLWEGAYDGAFSRDQWAIIGHAKSGLTEALGDVGSRWTSDTPLRRAIDRRQALVEIDAIVALMLGVTADELCSIYRTQFPVLVGYDRNDYLYDANGRLVPTPVRTAWRKKGDALTLEERTATNPAGNTYVYELPFTFLDREADMRAAYTHFERILEEQGQAVDLEAAQA